MLYLALSRAGFICIIKFNIMKTTSKIIAIAITTFFSVDAMAQELAPAPANGAGPDLAQTPPAPRPGRESKGRGRGPGRERGGELRELTAYKGTVVVYTANDHFEYDGFTFKSGSATYNVKFPAHMGQQLMKSASKGSTVTINGVADTDPEGQNMLRMVTLQAGGTTISDTRGPRPELDDSNVTAKKYTGTIQEVTRNRDGNVNGAVIGNNQLVTLPPHITEQLGTLIKTGQKVEVYGFERPKRDGVVMSRKLQSIDAQTLKIGDKTYLIR